MPQTLEATALQRTWLPAPFLRGHETRKINIQRYIPRPKLKQVSWGDTDDPHKMHQLRHPADINKPLREAAREKVAKYQSDYANDQRISFMLLLPALSPTI